MTVEQLEKKIAELQKQINEMKREKIWKPLRGETYFYVDNDGTIEEDDNNELRIDLDKMNVGNCYQTEEKAEFEANREKYTRLFRQYVEQHTEPLDWKNINQDKYSVYSSVGEGFYISPVATIKNAFQIYASSDEILRNAIEFVGEENFKKYILEVE